MPRHLIFWPVLAHVFLVLLLYLRLSQVKGRASERGEVDEKRRALFGDAWPDYVVQVSNNIRNQFELPALFHALTFVLWAANGVTAVTLGMAVAFVASRYLHAYIHIGSNVVAHRRRVFTFGVVVVLGMLVASAWALAAAPH